MASRIDHTNCSHPRTPAGRAACRKDWHKEGGIESAPAPLTREQLMDGMTTTEKARFARKLANDAAKAAGKLAKRTDSKGMAAAAKVTRVEDLPMPKLTPAQLASPVFRSLMAKKTTVVNDDHCTNCGRVTRGDDGYSGCCNEPVTFNCKPYADGGSCHH